MDGDHAWFRARASEPWHEITGRDDVELVARCGYTRSWTRSEQARGHEAPGPRCPDCGALEDALNERLTAAGRH